MGSMHYIGLDVHKRIGSCPRRDRTRKVGASLNCRNSGSC